MPRPGRSGTSIIPSFTRKSSSTRSCNSGLAPSEYSTMNPAGEAAATCSPAAKAGAPAHRCGASLRLCAPANAEIRIASVMPPQIARSGGMHAAGRVTRVAVDDADPHLDRAETAASDITEQFLADLVGSGPTARGIGRHSVRTPTAKQPPHRHAERFAEDVP